MTKIENALIWLYVKSWNHFGQHMLDENTLWYFGNDDLEAALAMVAYSKKKEDNGRTKDLKDLIMERFDNDKMKFFEWSCSIHKEVFESISASVQSDSAPVIPENNQTPVVEFRAAGLKNSTQFKKQSFYSPTLAVWRDIEWNHGGHFDGTTFTVPFNGTYLFHSTAKCGSDELLESSLHLFVNGKEIACGRDSNSIHFKTEEKLKKNDKVTLKISGIFSSLSNELITYFECKFVSEFEDYLFDNY